MRQLFYSLLLLLLTVSCVDTESYDDNPQGNLKALWQIMDEHYCFFEEKKVDWDAVYAKYAAQMEGQQLTESQQFEVMANMLSELRDGHVNLYTTFNTGRYWSWREDYPANFSDTLLRKYLKTDYLIAGGTDYTILDDNIGYLRYESFQYGMSDSNLDQVLLHLAACNGLIIDVRSNGGGQLTNAERLAARFCNEETIVGYLRHKTGRGHNDFSDMKKQTIKPAKGLRWQKDVVVLTNRGVFSAANEFVKYMKCFPHVTVVGDRTGGGAGLPFSAELPNGWGVRFSACPMYDRDQACTELGIEPDYHVDLTDEDFRRGRDTLIEFARQLLIQTNLGQTIRSISICTNSIQKS